MPEAPIGEQGIILVRLQNVLNKVPPTSVGAGFKPAPTTAVGFMSVNGQTPQHHTSRLQNSIRVKQFLLMLPDAFDEESGIGRHGTPCPYGVPQVRSQSYYRSR